MVEPGVRGLGTLLVDLDAVALSGETLGNGAGRLADTGAGVQ